MQANKHLCPINQFIEPIMQSLLSINLDTP